MIASFLLLFFFYSTYVLSEKGPVPDEKEELESALTKFKNQVISPTISTAARVQ